MKNNLPRRSSLKRKVITGLLWAFTSQGSQQVSQFVIMAFLARLLSSHDFGLMGMATVFTGFVATVNETGMKSALIHRQEISEEHYCSVFWLNLTVGVLLMLLMILASPWIAGFYNQPGLTLVLMALSVNFVIASFNVIQRTILLKEMNFRKLALVETGAVLSGGVVGIGMAWKGLGVWSLVFQTLVFTSANAALLWSLSGWRPKFIFSMPIVRNLFGYSVHSMGFNMVNYLSRNVDYLLVGKFLGSEALGYYTLAYKLMLYPLQNISAVIAKVMFPALATIQRDLERVRGAYLKVIQAISLVTFPMMAGLAAVASEFIPVIFGPKWGPVIDPIKIFCACGMLQSIGTLVGVIYQSQGRPDIQFKFALFVSLPSVVLSVMLGMRYGIYGVALFYTIRTFATTYVSQSLVNRLIGLRWEPFFKAQFHSFLIAVAVGFSIAAAAPLLERSLQNMPFLLAAKIFFGSAVFFVTGLSLNPFRVRERLTAFRVRFIG